MPELVKKCPECGGINLFWNRERGEVICKDCGLVIEDKMVDFTQEWREFDSEEGEKRRRSGAPMTYTQYDQGLGTEVGQKADLFRLGGRERDKFFRLRKWQYRISTAIERNLKLALAELKRVGSYLKLPKSVEEESARIYTLAVQRGLVRGRSMESVVAGALYAACRRHDVPRTLDELAEASGIEKKEIGRTYRFVTRELGITILPSNPADYIARFASALKLSAEAQSKSIEILEKAQKAELTSGRGPTGIAAAALYVAALMHGEKRTQREVADVAGVTEVTIRNRYKELLDELKLDKEIKKGKKKKKARKRR
jgi:transcription initiation factor TFIIB